ncbi:hypothetical protein PRZ48_014425 [Zasmidium cellare]|uniref:Hemerythrin-like domain-containing protein n=1 Tax=Zasmidium cellare TaxID=395010 RepID=A0ABR0DY82_ZASCE|nr:hypothetical protein PRZ48_014425 [Zasmidium cellare]
MDMVHDKFRQSWNTIYDAASANRRPQGMSIKQFLNTITRFTDHLTYHHTFEEQHIFPILAKRMDAFKAKGGRHLEQHERIHEGIEKMEGYVEGVRRGERELNLRELKGVMDSFGEGLWVHLDEEVETLGAENMRLYWSLEEMGTLLMM